MRGPLFLSAQFVANAAGDANSASKLAAKGDTAHEYINALIASIGSVIE